MTTVEFIRAIQIPLESHSVPKLRTMRRIAHQVAARQLRIGNDRAATYYIQVATECTFIIAERSHNAEPNTPY